MIDTQYKEIDTTKLRPDNQYKIAEKFIDCLEFEDMQDMLIRYIEKDLRNYGIFYINPKDKEDFSIEF